MIWDCNCVKLYASMSNRNFIFANWRKRPSFLLAIVNYAEWKTVLLRIQIVIVKFSPEDIDEANRELEFSGESLEELPALILFTEPYKTVVYKVDY